MEAFEPAHRLKEGSELILTVLAQHGFVFELQGEGHGSGGTFARGEFVKSDRRLEIHVRRSLGAVRYHVGRATALHEPYMRALGVWEQCRYPGFSTEPQQVFRDLAHDLTFAADFVSGNASILTASSQAEKITQDCEAERLRAGYTGQNRELEKMRLDFKAGRYKEVIAAFDQLPLPHLLTDAQLKLVHLSRARDA